MRILLTGARGFVGSRVREALADVGHSVKVIPSDCLRGTMTPSRYETLLRLFDETMPEALIHTAAISDTGYAEEHPEESYEANVLLTRSLAELTARFSCRFLSCSSDQVYNGAPEVRPHREDEPVSPVSVYGRHKLMAEEAAAWANPNTVSLRLTWMYDFPLYRGHTNNGFPLQLLERAAHNLPMSFSLSDYRGLTYVRSVADNMERALYLPGGVYNFGSENDLNMYETALRFMEALGLGERAPELILRKPSGSPRSLAMDTSLLKSRGIVFEPTSEGPLRMMRDYRG